MFRTHPGATGYLEVGPRLSADAGQPGTVSLRLHMEGWDSMEGDLLVCIVPGITVTERDTAVIGSHGGGHQSNTYLRGGPPGGLCASHSPELEDTQTNSVSGQPPTLSTLPPPKTFQTCLSLRSIRLSTSLRMR